MQFLNSYRISYIRIFINNKLVILIYRFIINFRLIFKLSFSNFSKEDIQKKWLEITLSSYNLVIATVITRNFSGWPFYFRDKIIHNLVPPEVKVLKIEFDYTLLSEMEKKSLNREKSGRTVHGIMCTELQNIIPEKSLCLLIDIDAYPLNKEAIMISFIAAKENGVFGNIQGYGDHLYIGPSFMCFDNEKVKNIFGDKVWRINERSDMGGEITWILPEVLDQDLFRPLKTIFKPFWRLDKLEKPSIGIGTTFGYKNKPMTYHHFYSRVWISKVHFFFVSFIAYLKIKFKYINRIKILDILKKMNFTIRHETKYGIKYIRNKLYE